MTRLIVIVLLGAVIASFGVKMDHLAFAVIGLLALVIGEAMWLSERIIRLEEQVAALREAHRVEKPVAVP